jgi:hypothetical protein
LIPIDSDQAKFRQTWQWKVNLPPDRVFRLLMEWDLRSLGGSRGPWRKEAVRPGSLVVETHEGDGRPAQWCRHTYALTPERGGAGTFVEVTFENKGSDSAFNRWSRIVGEQLMRLEREEREKWKPPTVREQAGSTVIVHGDYMPSKVEVRDSVINRSQIGSAPAAEARCAACGSTIAAEWNLCPKCGASVAQR